MLSCVVWNIGGVAPYKATRAAPAGHPVMVWLSESESNYRYASKLGLALCQRYTSIYDKVHKTQQALEQLDLMKPKLAEVPPTPFRPCVPEDCLIDNDPVASYRLYYMRHKRHIKQWPPGCTPKWFSHSTRDIPTVKSRTNSIRSKRNLLRPTRGAKKVAIARIRTVTKLL